MNNIAKFLQDNKGEFSSTRLAFLLWIIGTLIAWIWVSIAKDALQPIDDTVVTIIGILMTGKVVQKFPEGSAPQNGSSGAAAPRATPPAPAAPPAGGGAA